jgi:carboxyl-terminal processing protease
MKSLRSGKRRVWVLGLALIAAAGIGACRSAERAAPAAPPVPLTQEARQLNVASFDQVWQTIHDRHWDRDAVGPAWEQARLELRPKVEAASTQDEAREVMRQLIARLEQSHFGIIPGEAYAGGGSKPAAGGRAGAQSGGASSGGANAGGKAAASTDEGDGQPGVGETGLILRVLRDEVVVIDVQPDSPAARAGVRAGWVIRKIDGVEVASALAAVDQGVPPGSLLSDAMRARVVQGRLDGPRGTTAVVDLLDGNDRPRQVTLQRVTPPGVPTTFGNLPTIYYTFESRRVEPDVGLIAFSIFLDPGRLMPKFSAAVDSFRDARGIIIDLRGNPGGIGVMAMGVGNHFVTEPDLKLGTMTTRAMKLNFVLNPQAEPYTGKVAVLVDGLSLSTSEILAGGLQSVGRGRVFGTPTGGAALPSVIEVLPNGDRFQCAFADYVDASGARLEGRGVTPDQRVELTREALLAGRDPVVEAAVAWIRGGGQTSAAASAGR